MGGKGVEIFNNLNIMIIIRADNPKMQQSVSILLFHFSKSSHQICFIICGKSSRMQIFIKGVKNSGKLQSVEYLAQFVHFLQRKQLF